MAVTVALDQPFQGVDLAAAVKSAFTEAPFSAVWEGGDATTLDMTLDLPESRACTESLPYGTVVTIPVGIVVTTADGRVRGLSGSGTVRASVADAGLSELQLGLSTDLLCQSSTDALAYASVDCADVQGVTAQLLFNRYFGSPVADGGRLELYVYQRGSSMPGPANWVDRLELGP
jgi:hypothetical protein